MKMEVEGDVKSMQAYDANARKSRKYRQRPMFGAPPNSKFIYLLFANNHYDAVLTPRHLFSKDFQGKWCDWCRKPVKYGTNGHQCKRNCHVCNNDQCQIEATNWFTCDDCNKKVRNSTCEHMHVVNKRCKTRPYCKQCQRLIVISPYNENNKITPEDISRRILEHKCGEQWCPNCKDFFVRSHRDDGLCFVKASEIQNTPTDSARGGSPKYIFYDIETHTDEAVLPHDVDVADRKMVHYTDWVEAQYYDGTRRTFDTIDSFCTWLFDFGTHSEYTVIAHNGRGYDFIFVLQWLATQGHKVSYTHLKTVQNGTKVMSMKVIKGTKVIRFVDSLNFFACALSDLPKTFGIQLPVEVVASLKGTSLALESELAGGADVCAKGFFPYKFNHPTNQGYSGPVPDKHYFGIDTWGTSAKALDKKARFEAWWDYLRESKFEWNLQNELVAC